MKRSKDGNVSRRNFVAKATMAAAAAGITYLGLGDGTMAQTADTWTPDIIIEGTNNPAQDVPQIQAAVSAYSRILLKGKFNFGDGTTYPRQTVIISKGVEIRGETLQDPSGKNVSWLTEITGGGALIPSSLGGLLDSGPFKVVSIDVRLLSCRALVSPDGRGRRYLLRLARVSR